MRSGPSILPRARRRASLLVAVVLAVSAGLTALPAAPAGADVADPSVITDWNEVMVATVATDAGKANVEASMWFAYTHAAVYNAVVGITRRYELYHWSRFGPRSASPEAAAAVAAHDVLMEYFPDSASRLSDALDASLDAVPDGEAEEAGIEYGHRAAQRIIALRADDGRFGDTTFDEPEAPGVWRPTPPTFTPFFDPWLAELDPFIIQSPSRFRPGPPPGLQSETYTQEFKEVKRLGSLDSSARSAKQTETALFFSDIAIGALQASVRDLATRHGLDISESARLFAAVELSVADSAIAAWDGKLYYAWWRPVTAIHLASTDRNPNTRRDEDWAPLIATPPYPDYPSGLCNLMAAASRAIAGALDLEPGTTDLFLTSAAAGTTRHYTSRRDLVQDVIDARVWAGIHFRTADRVAADMGAVIARRALATHFQPA